MKCTKSLRKLNDNIGQARPRRSRRDSGRLAIFALSPITWILADIVSLLLLIMMCLLSSGNFDFQFIPIRLISVGVVMIELVIAIIMLLRLHGSLNRSLSLSWTNLVITAITCAAILSFAHGPIVYQILVCPLVAFGVCLSLSRATGEIHDSHGWLTFYMMILVAAGAGSVVLMVSWLARYFFGQLDHLEASSLDGMILVICAGVMTYFAIQTIRGIGNHDNRAFKCARIQSVLLLILLLLNLYIPAFGGAFNSATGTNFFGTTSGSTTLDALSYLGTTIDILMCWLLLWTYLNNSRYLHRRIRYGVDR